MRWECSAYHARSFSIFFSFSVTFHLSLCSHPIRSENKVSIVRDCTLSTMCEQMHARLFIAHAREINIIQSTRHNPFSLTHTGSKHVHINFHSFFPPFSSFHAFPTRPCFFSYLLIFPLRVCSASKSSHAHFLSFSLSRTERYEQTCNKHAHNE